MTAPAPTAEVRLHRITSEIKSIRDSYAALTKRPNLKHLHKQYGAFVSQLDRLLLRNGASK